MNPYIDYSQRIKKIQEQMKKSDLDLSWARRTVHLSYVAGPLFPGEAQ
jgi:hypothetical protein